MQKSDINIMQLVSTCRPDTESCTSNYKACQIGSKFSVYALRGNWHISMPLHSFLKPMGKILFSEHPYNCSSKMHKVPSDVSGAVYTVWHFGILQAGWNCLQLAGSQLYIFNLVSFYTAIFIYVLFKLNTAFLFCLVSLLALTVMASP